jgi:ABC-type Zn uptake system ZnuABC Zn-binding protein ZnuA
MTVAGLVFAAEAPVPQRVLCSTYPVYVFAKAVCVGRSGLSVELLLDSQLGCPHEYVLTPADLRRLSQSEVLIVNGLGMEPFLSDLGKAAQVKARTVNASDGLSREWIAGVEHAGAHGTDWNPHLFGSPRLAAKMCINIGMQLARWDPAGAVVYTTNSMSAAARLGELAQEVTSLGTGIQNRKVVTQHRVFDYLARDLGLHIVAAIQEHPGEDVTASRRLELVRLIRSEGVVAILSESQADGSIAVSLARETQVPVVVLDPFVAGDASATLDSYVEAMHRNIVLLRQTLAKGMGPP